MTFETRSGSKSAGSHIAPFLLATYPVLHLYSSNPGQAGPEMLVWPMVIAVVGTAMSWSLCWAAMRDTSKASLSVSFCVIVFFGFGYVFPALYHSTVGFVAPPRPGANPATYELQLQRILTFVSVIVLILGIDRICRLRTETARNTLFGVAAFAYVLSGQVVLAMMLLGPTTEQPTPVSDAAAAPRAARIGDSPDIYQIVLDGYGRQDVLARHFGFDNSPFIAELEELGFIVPSRSRANFYWTVLSLSSMLNMRYVTDLETRVGREENDYTLPIRWIRDNELSRFLKNRGYSTVHLSSTWSGTMDNPDADVVIPCAAGWFQNQFYRAIAENSLLRIFRSRVTTDMATCHLSQLLALADTSKRLGPKFVFAHFIPPHHPYLFDSEGRTLKQATVADEPVANLGLWARRDLYTDQLTFMNRRILEVIEVILATATRPTIVLLHSDHGPHLVKPDGRSDTDTHYARFANFVAVYAPQPFELSDDLELVNLYRVVLNRYFEAGLTLLPGEQHYSSFSRPFAFEQIHLQQDPRW